MRYVALLRGINVGGNRKVEMARLRDTFQRLGLSNVQTFIASGNVVFSSPSTDPGALTRRIEAGIAADFGFEVAVLLRDHDQIAALVKAIPVDWVNDSNMKCDVMFLWPEVDSPDSVALPKADPEIEDVLYHPGAIVWRVDRANQSRRRVTKIVGTPLHRSMTVRNPNTVRSLLQMMEAGEESPRTTSRKSSKVPRRPK